MPWLLLQRSWEKRISMNRLVIASFTLIFILGILIGLFFDGSPVSGSDISLDKNKSFGTDYVYTKAVCNSTGCVDVVVNCSSGNVSEIKSASNSKEFGFDLRNSTNISC